MYHPIQSYPLSHQAFGGESDPIVQRARKNLDGLRQHVKRKAARAKAALGRSVDAGAGESRDSRWGGREPRANGGDYDRGDQHGGEL